jgi:ribokinase
MRPKITVIGSLNMDVPVRSSRVPNIGVTILGESVQYFPGEKGLTRLSLVHGLGQMFQ